MQHLLTPGTSEWFVPNLSRLPDSNFINYDPTLILLLLLQGVVEYTVIYHKKVLPRSLGLLCLLLCKSLIKITAFQQVNNSFVSRQTPRTLAWLMEHLQTAAPPGSIDFPSHSCIRIMEDVRGTSLCRIECGKSGQDVNAGF